MSDTDLRLDGNAAGGILAEVFMAEMTAAIVTCATCGATGAIGSVQVYDRGPGTVLRCPACTSVLMRFAHVRGRMVADLHGVGALAYAVAE